MKERFAQSLGPLGWIGAQSAIASPLPGLLVAASLSLGILCRPVAAVSGDTIFMDGFEALRLLAVTNAGGGAVTSDVGGIDCGATCSAMFQDGSTVILRARTTNGSGYSFTGWSGDCGGSFHDCTLTMSAARNVTAIFSSQPFNLAFVSSATFATNLGSASAYDSQCNALATGAGINNAAGNAYVAWVSSFATTAASRLGTARGWVRLDGAPFADDTSSLQTTNKVFNSIDRDETGAIVAAQPILTGTQPSGTLSAGSCSGWSTTAGVYGAGDSSGGPIAWTYRYYASCATPARLYCLMKTASATLTPALNAGRKIWVTSTAFLPGSPTTPDQACDANRPDGVASAKAVIATASSPAADALSLVDTYVRPDGQVVGTGAEIVSTGIRTGIWQIATGAYLDATATGIWTGDASDLTVAGTNAGTCANWTSSSGNGAIGLAAASDARWWNSTTRACSSTSTRLICAEQ